MKLQELDARKPIEHIAKVFESHHGQRFDFQRLKSQQAQTMLKRVRALIREHKTSPSFHYSERNPDYLRLVMMEQALVQRISEMGNGEVVAVDANDPKTQAALKKAQSGQTLNPEETKLMAALAAMKKESRRAKRMVREASELQQAQVVLAAQDMIDRVQKMMEDISEMQFKDLPALTDSIKNDMGMEQASQFQSQASAALTNLLGAVQAGKTELEGAQGVLTGQAPQVPGAEAVPPADLGAEPVPTDSQELPPLEEPEAAAPEGELGRERR